MTAFVLFISTVFLVIVLMAAVNIFLNKGEDE